MWERKHKKMMSCHILKYESCEDGERNNIRRLQSLLARPSFPHYNYTLYYCDMQVIINSIVYISKTNSNMEK